MVGLRERCFSIERWSYGEPWWWKHRRTVAAITSEGGIGRVRSVVAIGFAGWLGDSSPSRLMRRGGSRVRLGLGPSELWGLRSARFLGSSSVEHAVPLVPWKHGADAVNSLAITSLRRVHLLQSLPGGEVAKS
jgi:hypothetical protein